MTHSEPLKFHISVAEPAEYALALGLVAQNWPEKERLSHLAQIQTDLKLGSLGKFMLLTAKLDEKKLSKPAIAGALLTQTLAGRAAQVWLPVVNEGLSPTSAVSLQTELLAAGDKALAAQGVNLAQILLRSPSRFPLLETTSSFNPAYTPVLVETLLPAAGYFWLANLQYLSWESGANLVSSPAFFSQTTPLATARQIGEKRLLSLIEATYQGTLDSPQINGLRKTADVLAGYREVGDAADDWWLVAQDATGNDLGCLLLAFHAEFNQFELIYLGVAPAARGQGLGCYLTQQAQQLAVEAGCERIVLAVDTRNHYALKVYESCGFSPTDSRQVWIRSLTQNFR